MPFGLHLPRLLRDALVDWGQLGASVSSLEPWRPEADTELLKSDTYPSGSTQGNANSIWHFAGEIATPRVMRTNQ